MLVQFKSFSGLECIGLVRHTDWENGCYYIQAMFKDTGEEYGNVWVNIEDCEAL